MAHLRDIFNVEFKKFHKLLELKKSLPDKLVSIMKDDFKKLERMSDIKRDSMRYNKRIDAFHKLGKLGVKVSRPTRFSGKKDMLGNGSLNPTPVSIGLPLYQTLPFPPPSTSTSTAPITLNSRVVNLSSVALDVKAVAVLSRGLNFSFPCIKTPVEDIMANVTLASDTLGDVEKHVFKTDCIKKILED